LVGMQIGAATMEISIEASQETQNRTIIWSCYMTCRRVSWGL
jgi:hypothetical protein